MLLVLEAVAPLSATGSHCRLARRVCCQVRRSTHSLKTTKQTPPQGKQLGWAFNLSLLAPKCDRKEGLSWAQATWLNTSIRKMKKKRHSTQGHDDKRQETSSSSPGTGQEGDTCPHAGTASAAALQRPPHRLWPLQLRCECFQVLLLQQTVKPYVFG